MLDNNVKYKKLLFGYLKICHLIQIIRSIHLKLINAIVDNSVKKLDLKLIKNRYR